MALICYRIRVPECRWDTCIWAPNPKKAFKDAAKIELERRGRRFFGLDNRQFVNATAFLNYVIKNNTLDTYCTVSHIQ